MQPHDPLPSEIHACFCTISILGKGINSQERRSLALAHQLLQNFLGGEMPLRRRVVVGEAPSVNELERLIGPPRDDDEGKIVEIPF